MEKNINSFVKSMVNLEKRVFYTLLIASLHLILPYLGSIILGNLINGLFSSDAEWVYLFLKIILYIPSGILIWKSFHETKPDVWVLCFFLGDPLGTLSHGTSYVPGGFLEGATQEYTSAWINFNEILHVVKLEDIGDKVPQDSSLDGVKTFKYKMEIKIEGALRIDNPLNFYRATGLKSFNKVSFERKIDKFYSTVIADISSNMDTIAADWGYAKFKERTDWTLDEIIEESERISRKKNDSLQQTLDEYGLTFEKISTYTKFDPATEEILARQFQSQAQRANEMYKAETEKKVKKINAQAEVVVSKERAKAIEYLTGKIAEIPKYEGLTASEVKEMVEASMDIWDSENLNKQILDIKGLPEIVKGLVPVLEKLLQAAVNKKTA